MFNTIQVIAYLISLQQQVAMAAWCGAEILVDYSSFSFFAGGWGMAASGGGAGAMRNSRDVRAAVDQQTLISKT